MPAQKHFRKFHGKSAKNKDTTANEYLAVGVDFEEAGEKWRAGDAQKSARFFVRALDNYNVGLEHFPQSFDLAYNRARLQFGIAQQPRLLKHLPGNLVDLLRTALGSHKYALELNQANADLLFNTGQVLTSLAELISEGRHQHDDVAGIYPLSLFQEALEVFQRCLSLQEYQFTQSEADACAVAQGPTEIDKEFGNTTTGNGPLAPRQSDEDSSSDESWAIILEPVTQGTLLDTLLVQVETLTSICGLFIVQDGRDPSWIENYFQNVLQKKICFAAKGTDREHESRLAEAKFRCALADAGFGLSRIDLLTYEREIAEAYDGFTAFGHDPQALCDKADTEITFNASIERYLGQNDDITPEDRTRINVMRWKHLTKALDSLTAASKIPGVKNLVRIHLRRGDCEMLRRRLGSAPSNYDIAVKSEPTLLKNAEIYYRGAARSAKAEVATDEEGEASAKEAITTELLENESRLRERIATDQLHVQEIIEDMIGEELLSKHDIEKLRNDNSQKYP